MLKPPRLFSITAFIFVTCLVGLTPSMAQTETPPYTAQSVNPYQHRFHEIYYQQPHNTYHAGSSLTAWLDAGYRSIELDVLDLGSWKGANQGPYIGHEYTGDNNCSSGGSADRLSHCLQDVIDWLDQNSTDVPILVFIDMKTTWYQLANGELPWLGYQVASLDTWIRDFLGDRLYAFDDLYTGLPQGLTARQQVRDQGWPTVHSMRGKIIVAMTGGLIGSVNQGMGSAFDTLIGTEGRFPSTFLCPDVESDPTELDVGGKIDGIADWMSQYFVCSNLKSRDHYQVTANRAADNRQLIHLWGDHVFGNTHYTYNYLAVAHGIQAIGQDFSTPSQGGTWNGSLPLVGVRRSLPGYFQLRPSDATSMCLAVDNGSYSNGSDLEQQSCNGSDAQRFVYTAEGQLRPKGNNRYCVDIEGGTAGTAKKLHLWDCDGGSSEKWQITPEGRFRSGNDSSYCIDADVPTHAGVRWQTWGCGSWDEQHFWLGEVPAWSQTTF